MPSKLITITFSLKFHILDHDRTDKKMTWAEYRALEFEDTDNFQYELLNGEIVKKASPTVQRQRISMRLIAIFLQHLSGKDIGEIFHAPPGCSCGRLQRTTAGYDLYPKGTRPYYSRTGASHHGRPRYFGGNHFRWFDQKGSCRKKKTCTNSLA